MLKTKTVQKRHIHVFQMLRVNRQTKILQGAPKGGSLVIF